MAIEDGLAAPITEFVRREPRFQSWYPPILDITYTFRGELYGLLPDLRLPGVFINVSAYQEAGQAVPRTPWTYEDVKNNAIQLEKADADGTITLGLEIAHMAQLGLPINLGPRSGFRRQLDQSHPLHQQYLTNA